MKITITQLIIIIAALLTLILVLYTTTNLAIIVPVITLLTEVVYLTLTGQARAAAHRKAEADNQNNT